MRVVQDTSHKASPGMSDGVFLLYHLGYYVGKEMFVLPSLFYFPDMQSVALIVDNRVRHSRMTSRVSLLYIDVMAPTAVRGHQTNPPRDLVRRFSFIPAQAWACLRCL